MFPFIRKRTLSDSMQKAANGGITKKRSTSDLFVTPMGFKPVTF